MNSLIFKEQAIQAIDDYTKGKPLYDYPWQIVEVIKNIPPVEHELAKCVETLNAIAQIISISPLTIQEDVFRYKMICEVMQKYEAEKNGQDI